MELIGMETIREFIETVLLTGRIKNTSPVSVLLIGSPECGKTSVVLARPSKCCIDLTDATGRGLMELCKYHPEITHFILNDMTAVMSHKQTVNRYTLAVINAMTEEGIRTVALPGQTEVYQSGKKGIIACTTPDLNKDGRRWWNSIGLSSRMLPFFFDHSKSLQLKIHDMINREASKHSSVNEFLVPEKPVEIDIPKKLIRKITELALHRAEQLGDPKGYRRLKQYRALVKGHALLRNKNQVNEKDVEFLERMDRFVSYRKGREI